MLPDFGKYSELVYICYGLSFVVLLGLVLNIVRLRRHLNKPD